MRIVHRIPTKNRVMGRTDDHRDRSDDQYRAEQGMKGESNRTVGHGRTESDKGRPPFVGCGRVAYSSVRIRRTYSRTNMARLTITLMRNARTLVVVLLSITTRPVAVVIA